MKLLLRRLLGDALSLRGRVSCVAMTSYTAFQLTTTAKTSRRPFCRNIPWAWQPVNHRLVAASAWSVVGLWRTVRLRKTIGARWPRGKRRWSFTVSSALTDDWPPANQNQPKKTTDHWENFVFRISLSLEKIISKLFIQLYVETRMPVHVFPCKYRNKSVFQK